MKVFIFGKEIFDKIMRDKAITNDNVESRTKTFFISINDTCGTHWVPYFENKGNVKVMYFDDIEEDLEVPVKTGSKEMRIIKAFSKEQAKELFDFIVKHKDKETCIVHCAAGISRSGAVGTFINDFFKQDFFEFKKTNPYIHPNPTVTRLLKEVASEYDET